MFKWLALVIVLMAFIICAMPVHTSGSDNTVQKDIYLGNWGHTPHSQVQFNSAGRYP